MSHHRSGRPATYSADEVAAVIAALDQPAPLGSALRVVDLEPLAAYLLEHKGIAMRRSRIDESAPGGYALAAAGDLVGERVDPEFTEKGRIETLYAAPPDGSVVVCLDEIGPVSAKSYPGRLGSATTATRGPGPAGVNFGRRGKDYIFGAFFPDGAAPATLSGPRHHPLGRLPGGGWKDGCRKRSSASTPPTT